MANQFSIREPKINPTRNLPLRPDGTPDDEDRIEIGPPDSAFAEWQAVGLTPPNLPRMREVRLKRLVQELQKRDYGGLLLFDPLNIRYATDCSNMHVWITHNPARAVFVSASGYMVLWDFDHCEHLSAHLPLVRETRTGASFFYFLAGDAEERLADRFAGEVEGLLRIHAGDNKRLAVDKMELAGIQSLLQRGISLHSGQQVTEHARLIKGIDEINAMRCTLATCETAMQAMHDAMAVGKTEVELWSILHSENIKRGGEWIETRICSTGPRTNPWMQEAGHRRLKEGELLALDTDLVGPFGMCADLSRTWYFGDKPPSDIQRELYQIAYNHIQKNIQILKPGVSFRELTDIGDRLPEIYRPQRYGVMMHGVGLCDEFPAIYYPEDVIEGAVDYVIEPGMVFCVEAYIGAVGGKDGVKLEDQVLITENGVENLTNAPHDRRLLA